MNKLDLLARPALRSPRFHSLALGGALALVAFAFYSPVPAYGHGEADKELIEHLDDFEKEIQVLSAHVDAIMVGFAKGEDVADPLDELVEEWEHVEIHEVIEANAIHLYPPIWQGIYAMKQAAEKAGSATDMLNAGERTKGAFWQSLGGLRVLAKLSGEGAPVAVGMVEANNEIQLTGNDNMLYNETHFVVRVGEPVTLRFENIGEIPKEVMGHNVVVLEDGTAIEPFGLAAAEAAENDFIPTEEDHAEEIVAHTALLGPGEVDEITFTLQEPGEYPFICTFTAHFRLMYGTIEAIIDPGTQPVEAILGQLESAVEAYAGGEGKRAEDLVLSAYMNIFEGLEGDLIEQDPELVTQLELDFNAGLPSLFQDDAAMGEVRLKLEAMRESLEQAKKLLAETERSSVF